MSAGAPVRAPSFRRELARKAIHLSSASVPLFLALGGDRTVAVAVLGVLAVVAAGVEIARAKFASVDTRFSALFHPLLRAHESRHVTGATWLLCAMFGAVLLLPRDAAIAASWAAAVGDAAAALIGMRYGRHRSLRDGKSVEGSVACLIATALGALLLAQFDVLSALLIGVSAMVAERLRWPRDDNMRIIALVGVTALIAAALR